MLWLEVCGCKEGDWVLWFQDHLFVDVLFVIYDWLHSDFSVVSEDWMWLKCWVNQYKHSVWISLSLHSLNCFKSVLTKTTDCFVKHNRLIFCIKLKINFIFGWTIFPLINSSLPFTLPSVLAKIFQKQFTPPSCFSPIILTPSSITKTIGLINISQKHNRHANFQLKVMIWYPWTFYLI